MKTAALRAGEAIRQARREGRCGTSVERCNGEAVKRSIQWIDRPSNGARPRTTRGAGGFCVVGSSKGSPVVPLRASPVHTLTLWTLPAPQNPLCAALP